MPDKKPVRIISDAPELKSVEFGFEAYARTIADLIANKENKTPLVIGIYGAWGSGKTTLMETVKDYLTHDDYKKGKTYRKCKTVWFQAWKYDKEDEILAALIEEIFKTMKMDGFFESAKAEIEKIVKTTNPFKALGKVIKASAGIDITEIFSELEYKQRLGFYDTFQDFFDRLLWTYTNLRPKLTSSEPPDDTKGALVIFIDDLDRCPRARIVKVLETIKLFMDKKGCVFVIGAANEIIEEALKDKYRDQDASKFMDKIVQVTFNLPQISDDDFETYMDGMDAIDPDSREKIRPYLPHILPTTQNNPRRFKRFLNDLYLMEGIHRNKNTGIAYQSLLFWKIVEFEAPELVREANDNPEVLNILRDTVVKILKEDKGTGRWEIPADKIKEVPQRSLHPYLENRKLIDLIRNMDVDPQQVRQLISLGSIVKSAETVEDVEERIREREFESRAKHKLDEMVRVPAGEFKFGDDQRIVTIAEPFEMDIYPVTNAQFKAFVMDKGYVRDDCWSEGGKEWKEEENITQPRYWDDEKWNQPEHPVVGVSYYEAEAFAAWAGKSLPTEEQWERAARDTDGREYPWGNGFDKEKCNTAESGIGKTTRVTRYPNGISPVGCYDMVGNVWEWTKSYYDEEKNFMVLRGGSWDFNLEDARCAFRANYDPDDWYFNIGFRCVRTSK